MAKRSLAVLLLFGLGGCPAEGLTFTPLAPEVPHLRLPQNDAYQGNVHTGSLRPRFVWVASEPTTSEPVVYELQVSSDPDFSALAAQTAETSYQPTMALAVSMSPPVGLRYYWRVRACARNSCSPYSAARWVNLGRSISDYNGDGFDDLAIGAPGESNGRVYLYFGGSGTGFDVAPDAVLMQALSTYFGSSLASAGDVNGDGFADLLVGARVENNNAGTAYLYLGGAGRFETTLDGIFRGTSGSYFGWSLAGAGDLNGDGVQDFAIGAPTDFSHGAPLGSVSIYFGSRAGTFKADRVFTTIPNDQLGKSVLSAGDMNGDGFADLAVGALGENNFGSVYVYLGGAEMDGVMDLKVPGNASEDFEGASLASSDFDADGFSDLIVGRPAFMATVKPGRVDLYRGGETLDLVADRTLVGAVIEDKIGYAVSVGDVDGDSSPDLAFSSRTLSGVGRVELYRGEDGTISMTNFGRLTGGATTSFGTSITAAGDLNGDGFDDLVVAEQREPGRVYVFFGGAPFDAVPDGVMDGPAEARFGDALANP